MLLLFLSLLQDPAPLLERLRTGGLEEREEAVRRLEALGPPAIPALEKAAEDADAEVAGRARTVLARIRAAELLGPELTAALPGAVDRLLKEGAPALFLELAGEPPRGPALKNAQLSRLGREALRRSRDDEVTAKILGHCGSRGMDEFLPEALAFLDSPSETLAAQAAGYLERATSPATLPRILEALESPRARTRAAAARLLVRLRGPEPIAALAKRLVDPAREVRIAAGRSLLDLNVASSAPAFRPFLREPDVESRLLGIEAARRWGDVDALPHLPPFLADPKLRLSALMGLCELGSCDAAPILPLLQDPEPVVRAIAALLLGRLRAREALPSLQRMLADPEPEAVAAAVKALWEIGDRESARGVIDVVDRDYGAIEVAGRFGFREAVPALLRRLKHESPSTRGDACRVLAALGATEAVDAIRSLLQDPESHVRDEALQALHALAGEGSWPDLLRLRADPVVKGRAMILLQRSKPSEAQLLPLLEEKDDELRAWALRRLAEMRSPRALQALRENVPLGRDVLRRLYMDAEPKELLAAVDGRFDEAVAAAEVIGERNLRELIPDLLKSRRAFAALALGLLDAKEALPACLERLERGFDAHAFRLAGFLGDPAAIPAVRKHLAERPRQGAEVLKRLGDPELGAALIRLLKDPAHEQRFDVARLLGEFRVREAVPDLVALLKDPDPSLREDAVIALRNLEARTAVPALRDLLRDPEEEVREEVVETLLDLEEEPAAIARLVAAETYYGRHRALRVLGSVGTPAEGEAVAALLGHAEKHVVVAALDTLSRLKARAQAAKILPLLEHADEEIAREAACALGRLGAPEALAPLLEWLSVRRPETGEALAELSPDLLRPAIRPLARESDDDVRKAVAPLLGRTGEKDLLLELLSDESEDVRRAAVEALARMNALDAAPRIRLLLRGREGARSAAVRALAELKDREAIPELRRLLKSGFAAEVVDALEALDAREAIPDLLAMLEDPLWNPKAWAARVLAAWGVEEARPRIRRWIPHDVRMMAAAARLGDVEAVPAILKELERQESWIYAAEAAAALGAKEAVPLLRERLADGEEAAARALLALDRASLVAAASGRNARAREAAARRLCLGGYREGVPALLEGEHSLVPLNALRSPAAWSRLARTAWTPRSGAVRRSELLEFVRSSIPFTWEGRLPYSVDGQRRLRVDSAADALEAALEGTPREAIVEEGRIRLVPAGEARAFWRAWWAAGGKEER